MGTQDAPAQLFYDFDLERHVPAEHMLREIDHFLDMDGMREALRPFYSSLGRPSIDPELIIRMLVIGYVMGIRSERRLCDEVHLTPGLPLVLSSRPRRQGSGSLDLLSLSPRQIPRQRSASAGV